ncbi:MAG TPA: hypothetical protein VFM36_00200 [Thermoanaerobaculia bacterium]|nr:hypothetical protein [Thermoanaerobaculia bacterium]
MRTILIAVVILAAILLPAPLLVALTLVAFCTIAGAATATGRVNDPERVRVTPPLIAVRLLRGPPR